MADPTGRTKDSGPYVVVARRYRPQTFDDLVGQATVSQALCNAITTKRVGHAYLFTGARGVGKTSTARILAKSLNCEQGPTVSPCGTCDPCQQIAHGSDIDVLEIDGASNRGIDEIRQLRSNVGIRPSRARFKIYIIDEVHMLTKEAFNALLKTLEEPPEHVKFVFCTTEPERIPVTVLSRCQRFDFAPVMSDEIVKRLQHIVQEEGAEASPEALELLARRAAGSMRDSQSLLEQLLSFVGERVTVDHVHAMLGTAHDTRLQAILRSLSERDAAAALGQMNQALDEGVDAGQLAEQLVGSLRDLMAAFVGCGGELLLHYAPSQLESLRSDAQQWGIETLLAAAQIVDQALARMRHSVHPRILLELSLVRIAQLENLDELAQVIERVEKGEIAVGAESARRPGEKKNEAPPAVAHEPALERGESPVSDDATPLAPVTPIESGPPTRLDAEHVGRIWRSALELLNDMTAESAAMAESVAIIGPNRLVVRFPQRYNASKTFCERAEKRRVLEQAVSEAAGHPIRLEFELIREDPPHEAPTQPAVSRQTQRQQAARHPYIERAVELFDAEVVNVDVPQPEARRNDRKE